MKLAEQHRSAIVLEDLQSMKQHGRKRSARLKGLNYALSNFDYAKVAQLILYKARRRGIPVFDVTPAGTSQNCARCLLEGKEQHYRRGVGGNSKIGRCDTCGQIDADLNAARTIAVSFQKGINHPLPFGTREALRRKEASPT